jgi:predicted aconitase with swiveling domain
MDEIIRCQKILPGRAEGEVLATNMPMSFWGGVDAATGKIVDPRHDLFEHCLTAKVLVFPFAKGSAGAPAIILELFARQTAPAAIINLEAEPLLISGPILGRHLYGVEMPMATLGPEQYALIQTGQYARVDTLRGEIKLS